MPGGEDHSVSWRWAKPPREGSTCVIQALERRKTAMLSGRRGVPGRGEGLKRLGYNTDSICLNLNETSPASTSQPGSGSGVPSIQVLASKSPLWFYFLYIFLNSFFFFLSPSLLSPPFWKALYYAGRLPCSRLPPTSSPSAIVSNQFRKQR